MAVALVTGSSGLVGSESVRYFHELGFDVIGIDNDLRSYFFGEDASTVPRRLELERRLGRFRHHSVDIRNQEDISEIFSRSGKDIQLVVHAAAQPSHDWAAREPLTDFSVNATGTLVLLEATRRFCPDAAFIFMSTNKVYGDTPNRLPFDEKETRWEISQTHPYAGRGVDESMSIDRSLHSLFGVGKTAADLLVQEYGKYFGLKTAVFRGGCLTGPAHAGAELHGFLAWLVKCAVSDVPYTIHGYKGKQVRDNLHSADLVRAFWEFCQDPVSGEVYNMGGSIYSHCSVIEAIRKIEEISGKTVRFTISDTARVGDHIWWISDVTKFRSRYPAWEPAYDLQRILEEMVGALR